MSKRNLTAACWMLMASLCLTHTVTGQIPNPLKKKKKEPETPTGVAFDPELYRKIRNFTEGLYNQPDREDFRLTADQKYEELLRAHGRRAFETNTSPKSEIKVILEDRFRLFTGLYDNLMIQDVVNRMGQQVAPRYAENKLFAFKLIADPVPSAEALSTGTIYITTGLVAMIDNAAQLSYVLAHEAAHVAKDHWRLRTKLELGREEYARQSEANAAQVAQASSLIGFGIGAAAGGLGAGRGNVVPGSILGGLGGALLANLLAPQPVNINMDWNRVEEDEADELALKAMLDAKFNVKQVPELYLALDKSALKDDRVGMGFWGNRMRMRERLERVNGFLKDNEAKLKGTPVVSDNREFRRLVSELKRDNGILAYHYDMLDVAKANLEQAVEFRNADPVALYYYGKVLRLVSRSDEDRQRANEAFAKASNADKANHAYGALLHQGIALIESTSEAEKRQGAEYLEKYVLRYVEAMEDLKARQAIDFPPHMDALNDYAQRAGVPDFDVRTILRKAQAAKQPVSPPPAVQAPAVDPPPPPPAQMQTTSGQKKAPPPKPIKR